LVCCAKTKIWQPCTQVWTFGENGFPTLVGEIG
jgi:hypothetical protein